jgi:hypothetical protein
MNAPITHRKSSRMTMATVVPNISAAAAASQRKPLAIA